MSKVLCVFSSVPIVDTPEEKAAAYRILKNFAKLSPESRQALFPGLQEVSGTFLTFFVGNQAPVLENTELPTKPLNILEISVELEKTRPERSTEQTTLGTVLFLISLLAAILNLPSFLLLEAKSIYLRIAWRYMIVLLLFVPKLLFDAYNDVFKFVESVSGFAGSVFGLALLNTINLYLVYFAASHTFVAHTLLLCSIPTTFLATWKIASKQPFTRLEYVGIGINVFGAYLCCCEGAPLERINFLLLLSQSMRPANEKIGSNILIGNFSAIAASALAAVYGAYSGDLLKEKKCPLSVYFALLSFYSVILCYILGQVIGEDMELFSASHTVGFFGLFSSPYAFF